jgi:hypothetical protein
MDLFRVIDRCPVCGGDATSRYHGVAVECLNVPGPHLHRRCEDCGFSWGERPVAELSARLRRGTVGQRVG